MLQQSGAAVEVGGDTHVHDDDARAGLGGERVDDGAARGEVGDHLRRDLLRPRGHALGVHPVVGGEHRHDGRLRQRRRVGRGQAGQLAGDVLEQAEGAAGLGQPVLVLPGGSDGVGVQRTQRREGALEHGGPLVGRSRP